MKPSLCISLLATALFATTSASAGKTPPARDFQIVERKFNEQDRTLAYYARRVHGVERTNNSLNRLSMLSENQENYPIPESGCGPTAMLNIMIWYEKYGLVKPYNRDSDLRRYKYRLFQEIDNRLTQLAGSRRTEESGTNNLDAAIVMDAIAVERSEGAVRIHTDIVSAPLKLKDCLDTMQNFRAGYLIVTPKDRQTGKLLDNHSVVILRADRAGYITLATWGEHYRGLLKTRSDGQWFIPQDPSHMELKIHSLMRFIPFRPTIAEDPKSQ